MISRDEVPGIVVTHLRAKMTTFASDRGLQLGGLVAAETKKLPLSNQPDSTACPNEAQTAQSDDVQKDGGPMDGDQMDGVWRALGLPDGSDRGATGTRTDRVANTSHRRAWET